VLLRVGLLPGLGDAGIIASGDWGFPINIGRIRAIFAEIMAHENIR
jgi:hypothetical protein